jgi:hypothetical protein
MGDFQKNEDFSFSEKNLNIKWYERKVNILKQAQRYCEKEKDKSNTRILRSLSFDNNGLVKPSCGTVALYGPFFKIWRTIHE